MDEEQVSTAQAGPEELCVRRQAGRLLHALLNQLKGGERELFVLVELEQMSVPEAAELLQLKLNTAYGRLRAARQHFEAALRRHRTSEAGRNQ